MREIATVKASLVRDTSERAHARNVQVCICVNEKCLCSRGQFHVHLHELRVGLASTPKHSLIGVLLSSVEVLRSIMSLAIIGLSQSCLATIHG